MPIEPAVPLKVFDERAFHEVDETVTGLAFGIHNEYGRYLDERLYQEELSRRLPRNGFAVEREVRIRVSLDDFYKDYYLDLLIDRGVIVETKTTESLIAAHRAQVLNYLFLCGLFHATLLNFRPLRVEREFVSTRLTPSQRSRVTYAKDGWRPLTKACGVMMQSVEAMMSDWGSCLDVALYREALTHFLGGESAVIQDLPVGPADNPLGTQKTHMLSEDVAFSVTTTSTHAPEKTLEHHRRYFQQTRLRAIQWINLNRQAVTFQTIS